MINHFFKDQKFNLNFTVSDSVYENFIATFSDKNPLHTDVKFAIEKGFNGKVMHGNILNGFLSFFIGEVLPIKNVIIHSQEIQFKHPVYLNDVLIFEATVSDIFESVNSIEFKFIFKNSVSQVVSKGKIQIGII